MFSFFFFLADTIPYDYIACKHEYTCLSILLISFKLVLTMISYRATSMTLLRLGYLEGTYDLTAAERPRKPKANAMQHEGQWKRKLLASDDVSARGSPTVYIKALAADSGA